jgi:Fic family protein
VTIEQLEDYMQFVPYELEGTFTSTDFAKAAHIPVDTARITLNILKDTQTVTRVGKQGRSYLYEVKENNRCM